MNALSPWQVLEIAATRDETEIRRAYAQKLRRTRPEDDAAGFALLRSAYEQALAQARSGRQTVAARSQESAPSKPEPARVDSAPADAATEQSGVAIPKPPAPVESPVPRRSAGDTADPTADLRGRYLRLQQLAASAAATEDALRGALDDCLRCPGLSNLQIQLQFEAALAQFLGQTQPRTECLLEPTIEHFGWRRRSGATRSDSRHFRVVVYADSALALRKAHTESPRAHRAITTPPRASRLWLWILLTRLDRAVLALLLTLGEQFPLSIDRSALEWWQRYFRTPQIRPELIWTSLALTALGILFGIAFATAGHVGHVGIAAAAGGAIGALMGGALTFGVLWIIDWPRHKLRTKRRLSSPAVRLGWAPAALGLCILSAVTVSNALTFALFSVLTGLNVAWTAVLALRRDRSAVSGSQFLFAQIAINLPILLWCVLSSGAPALVVTKVMWPALLGAMVISGVGQVSLLTALVQELTPIRQQQWRVIISVLALALLLLTWLSIPTGRWGSLVFAAMIGLILAHRVFAANLTEMQFRMRSRLGIGALWLGGAMVGGFDGAHPPADIVLRWGGLLFMASLVLTMLVSFFNGRAAAQRP